MNGIKFEQNQPRPFIWSLLCLWCGLAMRERGVCENGTGSESDSPSCRAGMQCRRRTVGGTESTRCPTDSCIGQGNGSVTSRRNHGNQGHRVWSAPAPPPPEPFHTMSDAEASLRNTGEPCPGLKLGLSSLFRASCSCPVLFSSGYSAHRNCSMFFQYDLSDFILFFCTLFIRPSSV